MDIPSFLHQYPPFDGLDEDRLAEIVGHTRIEFFPSGAVILRQSGEPSTFLYVVRTGAVELIDDEQVLDVLGEGEVFGHPSMLSGLGPTFTVRALEESLCYLIDREEAERVLGSRPGLAFLSSSLRRRVIRALEGLDPESADPWRTSVRTLVGRALVTCPPSLTVREAAALMSAERVSCLMIPQPEGWAIVTDRDMRQRVLALGRSPDTMVTEVSSSPVVSVEADTLVAEVISVMLERGIHHVPVSEEGGEILGMVTDTDLMGLEQKTPFQLRSLIERAAGPDEVVEAGQRLSETVCALVDANVEPLEIAHVVAVAIDALTRRLLEIGISQLGDPPAKWAWLSLGSEARQEQALHTDQDNAIAYDVGDAAPDVVDGYFAGLGAFVNDRLADAGIPKCRARVIAENPEWRRSLTDWMEQFRRWMSDPGRSGSAFTGIAFDYRQIAGPLEVGNRLDDVIREAADMPEFLRLLAKQTVDTRPPSGFLKDAVLHGKSGPAGKLDVKRTGITIVTNLARTHAIAAGLTENRTLRRLRDATLAGRLDEDMRTGLEEAFRLLWQIRLEHQTQQVRAGVPPDDDVDPTSLGPLARQGLKEAFRMIERGQTELAAAVGVRR